MENCIILKLGKIIIWNYIEMLHRKMTALGMFLFSSKQIMWEMSSECELEKCEKSNSRYLYFFNTEAKIAKTNLILVSDKCITYLIFFYIYFLIILIVLKL